MGAFDDCVSLTPVDAEFVAMHLTTEEAYAFIAKMIIDSGHTSIYSSQMHVKAALSGVHSQFLLARRDQDRLRKLRCVVSEVLG